MTRAGFLVVVVACNSAPLRYTSREPAPGSEVPWGVPTESGCDGPSAEDAVEIDGFTFCPGRGIEPIDAPVHASCQEVDLPGDTDVFWATDGLTARAWPTEMLQGRELVHEDWPLGPVLVDW